MKRIFVDLSGEISFGLGDTITLLPALRALKKRHPHDEIIVVGFFSGICVLKYCDYIDYILPVDILEPGEWTNGYHITMEEKMDVYNPTHSFLEHNKEHAVKSNIRHLLLESPENEPCEYELSVWKEDMPEIETAKSNLLKIAAGKKIVGIAPCITMYSRMWPATKWQELTDMLRDNNYFVVSLGHKEDLGIDVDFDARGLYPIHHIPKIIDVFDAMFVIDSGMMHIVGINPNIHMVKINTGQFPPNLYTPYRQGKLAYNTTVIEHNCPFQHKCFLGHATETVINSQMREFIDRWLKENEEPPTLQDSGLLQKYICWQYCYKESDKFLCNTISAKDVFRAFVKKKSTTSSIEEHPLPVYHAQQELAKDDFDTWKESILVQATKRVFVVIRSNFDIKTILNKLSLTKKLYPDCTLVVISPKKHVRKLQHCKDIFYAIPIEYLTGNIWLGSQDIFLVI